jgi:DNA-binding GntR family transcriptional regulator
MKLSKNIAFSPLESRTRSSDVVASLRRSIVLGILPPGMRLTETTLAEKLGVSRQPLREAIRELVYLGLLEDTPYKSLTVRKFTEKDFVNLVDFRINLEQFSFQCCWEKRTSSDFDDLRNRLQLLNDARSTNDPGEAIAREIHLHSWSFKISQNEFLLTAWRRLVPHLEYYFHLRHSSVSGIGPQKDIHNEYVRLACGNKLQKMQNHISEHVLAGKDEVLELIKMTAKE